MNTPRLNLADAALPRVEGGRPDEGRDRHRAAALPIRDALVDDASAAVVGAVFGLGAVVSAIGFLLTGKATLSARTCHDWRRYTPIVAGVWTTALVGIAATKALPCGVAVYGLCLLAVAIALYTDPVPAVTPGVGGLQLERA